MYFIFEYIIIAFLFFFFLFLYIIFMGRKEIYIGEEWILYLKIIKIYIYLYKSWEGWKRVKENFSTFNSQI